MMRCELLREWDSVIEGMPGVTSDVYMTEGYHGLYRSDTSTPVCLLARSASDTYVIPGILHGVPGDGEGQFFESAYGYGGPLSTSSDEEFVLEASDAVCRLLGEMGVPRARLRFHPVLRNERLVGSGWSVASSRDTAGINLAGTSSDILQAMHPKHRNMVSRAERSGLEFVWDEELVCLEEFRSLYNSTMDRLGAEAAYYYYDAYYAALRAELQGRVALGVVLDQGVAVAAAIFFRQGSYGHYHLSASLEDAPAGAGQLLVYSAAVALQSAGAAILHLGGGTSADPGDSLLRFKQRFGALRFHYYVGIWSAGRVL